MPPLRPAPVFQPNLGIAVMPLFAHMKAPRWRVASWEALRAPDRLAVTKGVLAATALLPYSLTDVELVGSYVYGRATLGSDLDFCGVVPDAVVRQRFAEFDGGGVWRVAPAFAAQMRELQWDLGVRLQFVPGFSNRDAGVPSWSLSRGEWAHKRDREIVPHAYRRDRDTDRFVAAPARHEKWDYAEDPWN